MCDTWHNMTWHKMIYHVTKKIHFLLLTLQRYDIIMTFSKNDISLQDACECTLDCHLKKSKIAGECTSLIYYRGYQIRVKYKFSVHSHWTPLYPRKLKKAVVALIMTMRRILKFWKTNLLIWLVVVIAWVFLGASWLVGRLLTTVWSESFLNFLFSRFEHFVLAT